VVKVGQTRRMCIKSSADFYWKKEIVNEL
jgi:hypothetical protein